MYLIGHRPSWSWSSWRKGLRSWRRSWGLLRSAGSHRGLNFWWVWERDREMLDMQTILRLDSPCSKLICVLYCGLCSQYPKHKQLILLKMCNHSSSSYHARFYMYTICGIIHVDNIHTYQSSYAHTHQHISHTHQHISHTHTSHTSHTHACMTQTVGPFLCRGVTPGCLPHDEGTWDSGEEGAQEYLQYHPHVCVPRGSHNLHHPSDPIVCTCCCSSEVEMDFTASIL